MQILEDAEKLRSKNNLLLNSCRLSLQHLNKVQLLANIDEEVRQLNHDNNRFLLSEMCIRDSPYTEAQNNKANYDLGVAELGGADNEATDLKWAKKN